MARTPAYTPLPPSFRLHYMTTVYRTLVRQRPMLYPQSPLTEQRWELSLLHFRQPQPMARISAYTPFSPSFHLHYMTTVHRSLVR